MMVFLTEETHKSFQRLFDRRVYLTTDTFCRAFVSYLKRIGEDFDSAKNGISNYSTQNGARFSAFTTIGIEYRPLLHKEAIVVSKIEFLGLDEVYRQCAKERKAARISMGGKPNQVQASPFVSDYVGSPGNGGVIDGTPVKIVRRKDVTSRSGKTLFNYLWNGRIRSDVDFLSCFPFQSVDGVTQATAYGANSHEYVVYTNGQRRKVKEHSEFPIERNNEEMKKLTENTKITLTIGQLRRLVRESIVKENESIWESVNPKFRDLMNLIDGLDDNDFTPKDMDGGRHWNKGKWNVNIKAFDNWYVISCHDGSGQVAAVNYGTKQYDLFNYRAFDPDEVEDFLYAINATGFTPIGIDA